ncbi:MAG: hypothetical protein ABJM06_03950 [Gilvibacter sp.]
MTLVKQFEDCKNCESQLAPGAEYCMRCGAQVIDEEFTFKFLKNDFSERFVDIDNNLLVRTVRDMVMRPEVVIGGYIDGVRKRHLRLSNYIAIAITLSGLLIFALQKYFPEAMDMTWMFDPESPAFKDNPYLQNGQDPMANAWWMEYQGIIYILMIPIYALMSKLTFLNQKAYSYLKHIVIVGYSQAQMSVVLFLPILIYLSFGGNYMKMSLWVMLLMFLYSCYVYKRIFKLSIGGIIGRGFLFIGIVIGVYLLLIIGVVIFVVATGAARPAAPSPEDLEAVKDTISYISSSAINWTS